jgi:single-strand DNA-binding protein
MNKVILMGRLTKDVELKYTSTNNTAICNFTIAVDKEFQKSGEERKADFLNCVAWGKTSEFISKYFSKGSMIAITGKIETRTWEDNEGKKHYATEIIVDKPYFTGSKNNNSNNANLNISPINEDDELPF